MNNYKLIACDLDGTLIGSDMKLSEENYCAIRELTKKGVLVVPATGRTISEMDEIYSIPEIRYVIYSNGSAVYDKLTGKKIFFGLDDKAMDFVIDTLSKYDAFTVLHKDGKSYGDIEKAQKLHSYGLNFNVEYLINKHCIFEENFSRMLKTGDVECVAVFFKNKNDMENCYAVIKKNKKLRVVAGLGNALEIFMKDAGKGKALEILAKTLNIEMKDVISIGDSDNDRHMTLVSGLGLVVENGCELAKEVADKVICTNDEHVINYVKSHYFDFD